MASTARRELREQPRPSSIDHATVGLLSRYQRRQGLQDNVRLIPQDVRPKTNSENQREYYQQSCECPGDADRLNRRD